MPHKRDRMILFPAAGSQLIVTTALFLMPTLIDTLQVAGIFSARGAGLLLSMELAVSALTTLGLSAWFRTEHPRAWALSGGLLTIGGTALTLLAPSPSLFFVSRLIAGFGAGIVGANATSVLSRGIDREKIIAILTMISIVNAALWLVVMPYSVDRFGYRGAYACILLICLAGTCLLARLPSSPARQQVSRQSSRSPLSSAAALVVLAIFLTQLGQGAFWSLEDSFGRRAGFSSHGIGVLLSAATLLLLLGAMGAAWAGDRFGRFPSMQLLILVNALSIVFISTVAVHWVFIAANVLQAVTNLSSLIYQLGLSASLDHTGRLVAAATGLVTLGNGLGPSLSTSLSAAFGASSVGIVVLTFNILALIAYSAIRFRYAGESRVSAYLT
ncbi:MAG: MFS transporter [Silvibacterium sp.]